MKYVIFIKYYFQYKLNYFIKNYNRENDKFYAI